MGHWPCLEEAGGQISFLSAGTDCPEKQLLARALGKGSPNNERPNLLTPSDSRFAGLSCWLPSPHFRSPRFYLLTRYWHMGFCLGFCLLRDTHSHLRTHGNGDYPEPALIPWSRDSDFLPQNGQQQQLLFHNCDHHFRGRGCWSVPQVISPSSRAHGRHSAGPRLPCRGRRGSRVAASWAMGYDDHHVDHFWARAIKR